MNKKILFGLLLIGLIAALAGAGMYAYFNDEAKSTANVFQAGTFEIELSNDGTTYDETVSATWTADNWAPGDVVEATLYIKNTGSLNVVYIKIKPTNLVDSDTDHPLSEMIIIDEFTVYKPDPTPGKTMSHMESWMESVFGDGVAPLTLDDFYSSPYWFVSGDEDGWIEPDHVAWIKLVLRFNPDADNDYQGDSCTFDLTIQAEQGEFDYVVVGDCGYGYA